MPCGTEGVEGPRVGVGSTDHPFPIRPIDFMEGTQWPTTLAVSLLVIALVTCRLS